MNNDNIDIIPGQDKFLQLHINELSKPIQRSPHLKQKLDSSMTSVILTAAIGGFVIGLLIAHCIGLIP